MEWEAARDWLLPTLEHCHGTHNEDDVIARVITGEYKLWRFEKCAVVTMFIQYPRLKALNVFMAGGDLEDLKTKQPEIERWAREQGCTRIVSGGREGWIRAFPDYSKHGALYYKDL